MANSEALIEKMRRMKREMHESARRASENRIEAIDQGHSYVTLKIPANREEMDELKRRHEQRQKRKVAAG